MFDEIEQQFLTVRNPEQALKMAAYMRNQFEFLGIRTPERRKLVKELYKEAKQQKVIDWKFVEQCWTSPYREFQYVAIGYLSELKKELRPANIPKIKTLIQTKSWWDTIDGLDKLIGEIAFQFPETKDIVLEWSVADDFWLRRIAIDHQLLRKEQTDTALLEKILVNNLNQTEFFINKAIGWSLRDYSKTNPVWVKNFIDTYQKDLSALSIREGSKYL